MLITPAAVSLPDFIAAVSAQQKARRRVPRPTSKKLSAFKCRTRSITALRIGSGHLDVMVPQRERADALARRLEESIEYRGRGHGNGRLAYAAPESTGRHDDRLDLGHLGKPHHLVAVEVLLLDASILHRALAEEQGGQSPYKRTGNLPLNLRWIDRIARISDANDAVDLDLVAVDRDLGAGGHVAAVIVGLREPAVDSFWRRRPPAPLGGRRIEHGKVLGMLCHQLAPEFELVVAARLGELVDEAFEVDGVVIDVHATPEAGLNMRVAHRMIDEDVRNRVADGRFHAARIQA